MQRGVKWSEDGVQAYHANGYDRLAAQWIFDGGAWDAWDMTKTNKAFACITNTAREDRKVAQVLRGWDADDKSAIIDISNLDHTTQERLGCLLTRLFRSRTGLKEQRLNISNKVLSVFTASLNRYSPSLKELAPTAPIVIRVEVCLEAADIPVTDILSLSVTLTTAASPPVEGQIRDRPNHIYAPLGQLLADIEELIASNKTLAARLSIVAAAQLKSKGTQETTRLEQSHDTSDQEPKLKRIGRKKKSELRYIVAFMKLFLGDGFELDENDDDFKDRVLETGRIPGSNVLAYLQDRGIMAKGAGTVLREMRKLLWVSDLDERIIIYRHLLAIDRIQDPAPADTQNRYRVADQV
ncbi:unnamed protein product [Phytophthora fragariaefolia]|uniref:Unnamed protein product n=1 Tax=Phytophthora fragariaefolia TaxID=1490495 RepID=A0A9W6WZU9_9STRA|nr:unnamed protein product [Phytophthora fragariaefolia]